MRNDKEVVLITGCSTGIGRALAEVLTDAGYIVIASARNTASILDLKVSHRVSLDVTDESSIKTAVDKIVAKYRRIDILVNNAGYAVRGALEEVPVEDIKAVFDVNVFGLINMVRHVVPLMRKAHAGKIIHIGSISGRFSQPMNGTYCASKYAVEALSDALRLELYGFNIQSTVIEPGPVKSDFRRKAAMNSQAGNRQDSAYADLFENFMDFMENQKETETRSAAYDILKILSSRRLNARYQVAVPFMSRCMPYFVQSVKEYLFRMILNIRPYAENSS